MRRRALIAVAALVACRGGAAPQTGSGSGSGSGLGSGSVAEAETEDWRAACERALREAATLTPVRRLARVIDGCQPCGSWDPLLRWELHEDRGGPTRAEIAARMTACTAFCDRVSELRFVRALDAARDQRSRVPWRQLGESCGAAVSALPDARYLSPAFFALDRIARATAGEPALAPLAAALELPLPALSLTGVGFDLARAPVTRPEAGPAQLTVTAIELRVGTLARAKLTAEGVAVTSGTPTYPGALVSLRELPAALDRARAGQLPPIAVVAPSALAAGRLIDALAAAGPRPLVLAVQAAGGPPGWALIGHIPVALDTTPRPHAWRRRLATPADVDAALVALRDAPADALAVAPVFELADAIPVALVAQLLGAVAYRDLPAATLIRAPRPAR